MLLEKNCNSNTVNLNKKGTFFRLPHAPLLKRRAKKVNCNSWQLKMF